MCIIQKTPFIVFLVLLSLSSCGGNKVKDEVIQSDSGEEIVLLEADDERVKLAYDQAQDELGAMEDYFNNDSTGNLLIYIKSKYAEGDEVEHMWGVLLSIAANNYSVRLDNEPYYLHNVAYGDTLSIAKTEVEDFMVYESEKLLIGNFMNW